MGKKEKKSKKKTEIAENLNSRRRITPIIDNRRSKMTTRRGNPAKGRELPFSLVAVKFGSELDLLNLSRQNRLS
jgi:hypothetical protein